MASSIEQIILDMEKFIDEESKPATFSSTKIVINRDDLYAFIEELKATTPKELRRYQQICLLYTSPSPRDRTRSRMPSSA